MSVCISRFPTGPGYSPPGASKFFYYNGSKGSWGWGTTLRLQLEVEHYCPSHTPPTPAAVTLTKSSTLTYKIGITRQALPHPRLLWQRREKTDVKVLYKPQDTLQVQVTEV